MPTTPSKEAAIVVVFAERRLTGIERMRRPSDMISFEMEKVEKRLREDRSHVEAEVSDKVAGSLGE